MTRRILALAFSAACLIGAACVHPKPPKPPEPPKPPVDDQTVRPTAPLGTQLQRVENGRFTIPWVGAIACWPPDDANGKPPVSFQAFGKTIPYHWPAFSCEWSDLVKAKGFNGVLVRIAPSPDSDVCCGLPGGEQSAAYWKLVHPAMRRATANDQMILVSVGWDGWVWKHQVNGDAVRLAAPTVEVEAGPIVPASPALRKHVFDVVGQTCLYMNVAYEISNESSLIPRWTPEWERHMYALIREAEKQPGCDGRVVHVVGSNTDDVDGPYEFLIYHDVGVAPVPMNGKAIMVNEYNPHYPPDALRARIAEFKAAGQSFWYWRSDGDQSTMEASLDVLTSAESTECKAPLPDYEHFTVGFNCTKDAQGRDTTDNCDTTPQQTKACEYCASIGMGEYNGAIRCTCPIRNECGPDGPLPQDQDPAHPGLSFQCNLRYPCEAFILKQRAPLLRGDCAIRLLDSGGFRFKADGCTWVEACDASGEHCTKKEFTQ